MKSMLKSLMSVAVAALAFTSCSKDATEDVMPNGGTKTLVVNATIDQTRTVMADNHVNLEWSDNDQIYLYIGKTAAKQINPKTTSKITGVTYTDGDMVYANYSEGNSFSTGVDNAEIFIKGTQEQSKASEFAGNYLPMVASGQITDGAVDLVFQPVGCVLVFNVYGQGKTAGEKIKSIKFATSENCCGYKLCNLTAGLTAEALGYKQSELKSTAQAVTTNLAKDAYATIGATKPEDTKVAENQVYMVVAPFNYEAATFTVTTDAGNTYTFKTANGIDCLTKTARVVNLNLAKSPEGAPKIIVPTSVDEQLSEGGDAYIAGIQFKNITTEQIGRATISVYGNAELTQTVNWITINDNTAAVLSTGTLNYNLAANTETTPRTAYIVIECAGVKSPAIAVTQVGAGSKPASMITMTSVDIVDNHNSTITLSKNSYGNQDVDKPSTYYTWRMNDVNFAGAQICIGSRTTNYDYTDLLQMRGNSTKSKRGFFGNTDDLKKITKVIVVSEHESREPTEHLYVGTSAYSRKDNGGVAVTRTDLQKDGTTYTETFNVSGDYGFFTVANDTEKAFYLNSITIYYRDEQVE